MHALLIASLGSRKNRGRPAVWAAGGGGFGARRGLCRVCIGPIAHANSDANAFADPQPDVEGDRFRPVGRCDRNQSWQQFSRASRQPVDQWLQPDVAEQSGRRRRLRERRGATFPNLVRGLRDLGAECRDRRFRRRPPHHLGRGGGRRRPGRARHQCRLYRGPEPYRHRRAPGAAICNHRSDPARLQRLPRQGTGTWAIALVHGFGNIHSSRDTGFGWR